MEWLAESQWRIMEETDLKRLLWFQYTCHLDACFMGTPHSQSDKFARWIKLVAWESCDCWNFLWSRLCTGGCDLQECRSVRSVMGSSTIGWCYFWHLICIYAFNHVSWRYTNMRMIGAGQFGTVRGPRLASWMELALQCFPTPGDAERCHRWFRPTAGWPWDLSAWWKQWKALRFCGGLMDKICCLAGVIAWTGSDQAYSEADQHSGEMQLLTHTVCSSFSITALWLKSWIEMLL